MSFISRLIKRQPKSSVNGIFGEAQNGTNAATNSSSRVPPKKIVKQSSVDAQELHLLASGGDQSLIFGFGLRWRTMVTTGGRDAAQKVAQKSNATHFIYRSQQVGYGILPKNVDEIIYPASILVAKVNAGASIFALKIDDGRYWFSVVRNGQPTNTDEVISGIKESQAVARIREISQQFEGEELAVYTDIKNSGIDGQKDFSLHNVFDIVRTDEDKLHKLKEKGSLIPKPVLYAGLFAVASLALQRGYSEYKDYQARKELEANRVVELTPEAAWAPVLEKFLASTPKPGVSALIEIRKSIATVPVIWSGWMLTGVRCVAVPDLDAAKNRPWSCAGTYERGRVADTSEEFIKKVQSKKPDWSVTFPSINFMAVNWTIKNQEAPIELTDMNDPNLTMINVASKLQGYFPALALRPEFKMQPFPLTAPKRHDGKLHPKPATVPDFFKGDLVLKGPLRSMDAMTKQLSNVEWEAMGLVFDSKSPATQKGLSTSSLTVELTGKVFGKK